MRFLPFKDPGYSFYPAVSVSLSFPCGCRKNGP
jgi:hypothetical protein